MLSQYFKSPMGGELEMSFFHKGVAPEKNCREGETPLLTHLGRFGLLPMTTKTASTVPIPMISRNSISEFSTPPLVFHPVRIGAFLSEGAPRHLSRRVQ